MRVDGRRAGLKGSSDHGGEGKEWWSLGRILEVELVGLAETLDVGGIGKRRVKNDSTLFGSRN